MRIISSLVFFLILTVVGCSASGPKPPSVTELRVMLKSADTNEQRVATDWIQQLGPKAAEMVPDLIVALKSPDLGVRQGAAQALGRIGRPAAEAAVPALAAALADSEYEGRRTAADALGQLGSAAASAIPELEKLSKMPDPCGSGPSALKKIRP